MSTPESASAPTQRAAEAAEALAAEGHPVTNRAVRSRAGVSMAVAAEAAATWNERAAAQAHIPDAPESVAIRFGGIWREADSAARGQFNAERETLTARLRGVEEENRSLTEDLTASDARVAELQAELEQVRADAAQAALDAQQTAAATAASHAAEISAERSRGDRAEGALDVVTKERDRLLQQIEAARRPAVG